MEQGRKRRRRSPSSTDILPGPKSSRTLSCPPRVPTNSYSIPVLSTSWLAREQVCNLAVNIHVPPSTERQILDRSNESNTQPNVNQADPDRIPTLLTISGSQRSRSCRPLSSYVRKLTKSVWSVWSVSSRFRCTILSTELLKSILAADLAITRLHKIEKLCEQIKGLQDTNATHVQDISRLHQRRRQCSRALDNMIRKRNDLQQGIESVKQSLDGDDRQVRNASNTMRENEERIAVHIREISRLSTVEENEARKLF